MLRKQLFYWFCLIVLSVYVQLFADLCNGKGLCNKPYNEVSQLVTHNATSSTKDRLFQVVPNPVANQHNRVAGQLNDGIRAFKIPLHLKGDEPWIAHTLPLNEFTDLIDKNVKVKVLRNQLKSKVGKNLWLMDASNQSLQKFLTQIKKFLEDNPREIITLFLNIFITEKQLEKILISFEKSGLSEYVYNLSADKNIWPTLEAMIKRNKRLVVFSDNDELSGLVANRPWVAGILSSNRLTRNHYDFKSIAALKMDLETDNRSKDLLERSSRSLYKLGQLNHFVTPLVGSADLAKQANQYDIVKAHVERFKEITKRYPNYIFVDFYDVRFDDLKKLIDELNQIK